MTRHLLPEPGTVVEMTADDDPVAGVRVTHADGEKLTLSMALAAVPPAGAIVTLRWPAGPRGRYAREAVVVEADENLIALAATGPGRIEQQRNYVRAGGGEQILLRRPGRTDAVGRIHDISEQSVRAYFADLDLHDGDAFTLRVRLDPDLVELDAVALRVAAIRQSLPKPGPMSVELVAMLTADEGQAQTIRRYVLRYQLMTRARTAG